MSKIMIVDDNHDIAQTLKIIVEREGHKTDISNNGQELLDKVESIKPNLVLLDVMMPGLTTKQILEKLKEKKLTALKIILVTVVRFSDEEKASLMKNFNIVDYITKPFDVRDLVARVKKQL
jgi:two-component system response regulator VicR